MSSSERSASCQRGSTSSITSPPQCTTLERTSCGRSAHVRGITRRQVPKVLSIRSDAYATIEYARRVLDLQKRRAVVRRLIRVGARPLQFAQKVTSQPSKL